jgi:hypothetical protein
MGPALVEITDVKIFTLSSNSYYAITISCNIIGLTCSTITLVSSRQDYLLPHQHNMSQQQNAQLSSKEGRIQLACSAYTTRQFRSLRRAAEAFNVPHSTLTSRYNGITHILKRRNGRQKLTTTEEQTIVRYILDLDSRGFAPRLCEVEDIADKQLAIRGSKPVSKH